jgi:hypothetical protein
MSPSQLHAAMTELRQQADVERQPESSRRSIRAAEAQAGRWSGVEFGSHAVTHASLPAWKQGNGNVRSARAPTGVKP